MTTQRNIESFAIDLQKATPIYYSGETLDGSVIIRLSKRLKIDSVSLTIKGFADVHW